MFRNSLLGLLIAAALSLCLSFGARGQVPQPTATFYVNPAASNAWPGGNGDSWDDAFADLDVAIADAPGMVGQNDIIRINVAGGTYFGKSFVMPQTFANNHTGGFAIPDRMLIYGGYAGVGADPDARDPATWTTTLVGLDGACGSSTAGDCFENNSPEAGCDDADCCAAVCVQVPTCCTMAWDSDRADWAHFFCKGEPLELRVDSVVATVGGGVNRRLDGLTITGGGRRPVPHGGFGQAAGGGVHVTSIEIASHVGLDIVRCIIVDNFAADGGGIALVGEGPPEIDCDGHGSDARARIWNCEIVDNRAVTWGGGVFARYQAPYQIVNSVIARNGFLNVAVPWITTNSEGAALAEFISAIPGVERRIVNCTITRNESGLGNAHAGIVQNVGQVWNCGAIPQPPEPDPRDELLIVNSVIRNNWYTENPLTLVYVDCGAFPLPECGFEASPFATVVYCNTPLPAIPDTWHDCIDVDPGFVEIDHDPGQSIFADYRLLSSSAMIDAGALAGDEPVQILTDLIDVNDDGSATDPNLDLDLEHRIVPVISSGCPRVDIGAYEFATANNCRTGDLNDDCKVDGADLGILLNAWGPCSGPCPADLDCDGVVDGADLGVMLNAWGSSPQAFPRDCCEEPESLLGGGESESSESYGLTAAELAEMLGFSSVAAMVDWLVEQPFGAMAVYLSLLG